MKKILLLLLSILLIAGCNPSITGNVASESSNPQIVILETDGVTYRPITVEANRPVILKKGETLGGCAMQVFQKDIGLNANFYKYDEYEFTPTKKGEFEMQCGMGMHKGIITVI